MQPFHATGLHRKIDNLMDRLFGAGVASHATIIEQINYLMFLRALTQHDEEAKLLNPDHDAIFKDELMKYSWDNLLMLNAEILFDTLEEAYRKLPELTTDKTVALLYRNAHIKIYDKPTLRVLVHEIEKLVTELDTAARHGSKDIFGDMYEYLLSKLAQAGTNGQFRTPRHVIKFMVDVVDPEKGETILDPACGTGGFLVEALNHLRTKYTSERFKKDGTFLMDELSGEERDFIFNHAFTGFDSDEDMVKFGVMNLYLHNLSHASIKRQNTLVDTTGDRGKWDVILANPPFSGNVDKASVSEDLRMGTGATEVLFLNYMTKHLSTAGRCGVIVPEGVLFKDQAAYGKIRQSLLDAGLWCVVSLPTGIFNPYAKTAKTSILFFDKTIDPKTKQVLFVKVKSDGYDLGSLRNPIDANDLPDALNIIQCFKNSESMGSKLTVETRIIDRNTLYNDPVHSLKIIGDSRIESTRGNSWPMVELKDILIPQIRTVEVLDAKEYKQITVKLFSKGVILRQSIRGQDIKTKRQFIAFAGDFIISKIDARHGAFGIVTSELDGAIVTSDFPVFESNMDRIFPKFLDYIVQSAEFTQLCEDSSIGTSNRKRLKVDYFLANKIPLPTIEMQKEIVATLDSYRVIADSGKIILKTYQPEIRFETSWPKVKLNELFVKLEAGVSVNSMNRPMSDGEHGILKTSAVSYGAFNPRENKVILDSELHRAKINPKTDSIIISRMNTPELVGASVYIDSDYNELYLPDRLWQADKKGNDLSMRYVQYVISSPKYRRMISDLSNGTSGSMKNISKPKLLNIEIPLPSLDVQHQIVDELESENDLIKGSQKLVSVYEKKIADYISEVWNA